VIVVIVVVVVVVAVAVATAFVFQAELSRFTWGAQNHLSPRGSWRLHDYDGLS